MPVVELGPGPARQILASLLSDSNFDYLIQASDADPEKIQSVLLMPREKKGTEAAARAARGPNVAAVAPPEAPPPDAPVAPQPETAGQEASPAPAAMQAADPSATPPNQSGQFPLLQPDSTNPAKPGALTPPSSLSSDIEFAKHQPTTAANVPAAGADDPAGSLHGHAAVAGDSWSQVGVEACPPGGRPLSYVRGSDGYWPGGAAGECVCCWSFLRL